MKIFLLADGNSAHTKNWVLSLLSQNLEVYLFSLNHISEELKEQESKNQLRLYRASITSKPNSSTLAKLKYLHLIPTLKKEIKKFNPDLIHAHYISSYGLLAYLSGFRPYVLSVWGSDIMIFPQKSLIHKMAIQQILKGSSKVFASSKLMLNILQNNYNAINSIQIPFGVDIKIFSPSSKSRNSSVLTFAIVKSLMETYGIDIAIKAFVSLVEKHPHKKFKLDIYGDGPLKKKYENLAGRYLESHIIFHGKIAHKEVPNKLRQADIFINVSRSESFGVSVLEASACGLAVIVSNRGGLPETVVNEKTGVILKKLDEKHCLKAMERYVSNRELIDNHGISGRRFVEENYDKRESIKLQIMAYKEIIEKNRH